MRFVNPAAIVSVSVVTDKLYHGKDGILYHKPFVQVQYTDKSYTMLYFETQELAEAEALKLKEQFNLVDL